MTSLRLVLWLKMNDSLLCSTTCAFGKMGKYFTSPDTQFMIRTPSLHPRSRSPELLWCCTVATFTHPSIFCVYSLMYSSPVIFSGADNKVKKSTDTSTGHMVKWNEMHPHHIYYHNIHCIHVDKSLRKHKQRSNPLIIEEKITNCSQSDAKHTECWRMLVLFYVLILKFSVKLFCKTRHKTPISYSSFTKDWVHFWGPIGAQAMREFFVISFTIENK